MQKTWKDTFRLLTINWDTLILFQISYKVIFLLLSNFASDIFDGSLHRANLSYVTTENVFELLKHPLTVAFLLLLLFLVGLSIYIEVLAIIIYCKKSAEQERITFFKLYKEIVKKLKASFSWSHLALFCWLCFLIPLTQIPLNSVFTGGFHLPEFMMQFVEERILLKFIYNAIVFSIFILFIWWVFVPHFVVLENVTFWGAIKRSMAYVKEHFLQYLLYLVVWNAVMSFFIYLGYFFFLMLLFLWQKNFGNIEQFWFYFQRLHDTYEFIRPILIVAGNFSFITVLYYQQQGLAIVPKKRKKHIFSSILRVACMPIICLFAVEVLNPSLFYAFDLSHISVVAHRGGGYYAPENTLLAIQMGIESKADYAEVDVQQTKDGILVLSHDTSLERMTAVSKEIYDVDYDELQLYSVIGSDEKIPTLEEVLRASKGKIKLMIELKHNGHEQDLEQKTIDLIKQYEMEDDCVISSLNFEIIKKVKEIDSSLKTAYIVALAYGNMDIIEENVDYYAVEATSLTQKLVEDLHRNENKVFVWTVNETKNVKKVLRLPIDGIITDDPFSIRHTLKSRGTDIIVEYLMSCFS